MSLEPDSKDRLHEDDDGCADPQLRAALEAKCLPPDGPCPNEASPKGTLRTDAERAQLQRDLGRVGPKTTTNKRVNEEGEVAYLAWMRSEEREAKEWSDLPKRTRLTWCRVASALHSFRAEQRTDSASPSAGFDPEHCPTCKEFADRQRPPKPPVEVKSELWDAARLKMKQLEGEIQRCSATQGEKSNMLHSFSKLCMFASDAWDMHVIRPAQRTEPASPDSLLDRYAKCAWRIWELFPGDPLGDDGAHFPIERLEALLDRGLLAPAADPPPRVTRTDWKKVAEAFMRAADIGESLAEIRERFGLEVDHRRERATAQLFQVQRADEYGGGHQPSAPSPWRTVHRCSSLAEAEEWKRNNPPNWAYYRVWIDPEELDDHMGSLSSRTADGGAER